MIYDFLFFNLHANPWKQNIMLKLVRLEKTVNFEKTVIFLNS